MAETTSNIEIAQVLHERSHGGHSSPMRRHAWIEILEAVVLAAVAVLTAWSGYQAAKWDAESAEAYARLATTTVESQELQTLAGQDHLYDVVTFDSWMEAKHQQDEALARFFEKRFRPEFAVAFVAWMQTNPFENPQAPPGPSSLPEYRSARLDSSKELAEQARLFFETGVRTRRTGDEYVRITVVLATVLLLTALAQRFHIRRVRLGLLAVGLVLLTYATFLIVTFPRV